ncbi:MAG: class I SAM-dependent methyltransferase [Kiritimatiellae bacterium]|nr:class I SAM-dependent methyltransferase [Kiritimatiellia bacterium]
MDMRSMQRDYWNRLSPAYQRIMEISVDDFHFGPQIPGDSRLGILPPLAAGARALELGCGGGQNSVFLAKRGLECHAIDISREQLAHARALARREGVRVSFRLSPIEEFGGKVAGLFDLIHSSHAFEFLDDPAAAIGECASRLAPGGTLVISTVHPLYNGEWVDNIDEDGNPCGMGLFLSNYFSPPDDIRRSGGKVDVISRAWPVSSWFNWLRTAGLDVTALSEPAEQKDGVPPYTSADWADNEGELAAIPGTLILAAKKPHVR